MEHYYYHWSPASNRERIKSIGLTPRRNGRKLRCIWLATAQGAIFWKAHIAKHQSVREDSLDLWIVDTRSLILRNHGSGRFTVTGMIAPGRLTLCPHMKVGDFLE